MSVEIENGFQEILLKHKFCKLIRHISQIANKFNKRDLNVDELIVTKNNNDSIEGRMTNNGRTIIIVIIIII
jgi:hypothetical protein